MNAISDFFGKFLKFNEDSNLVKQQVIAVIKELAGVELSPNQISLQDGTLSISCSPVVKTQILLFQEPIKEKLKIKRIK